MSVPAQPTPSRFVHVGVLTLTVTVFAAVVGVVTWQLRAGLREQILERLAENLASVVSMQLDNTDGDEPATLLYAVLKTSKLQGVAGVRVYNADRGLSGSWSLPNSGETPPPTIWDRLAAGHGVARLHSHISDDQSLDLSLLSPSDSFVEAWVPLRRSQSSELIGGAQFWMDGKSLEDDFKKHDQRLWVVAGMAWLAGSAVIVAALLWGFRRLDAANQQLRARSEDLQRANRELVLAAKTSALGTVTAHLMHELKNPLAGLEVIMAGQADQGLRSDTAVGGELAAASELTRRLRTMVNDVVSVLHDEQTSAEFELTCADIAEIVLGKVRPEAVTRGVKLETDASAAVSISGRRANLVTLVLRNLMQNALEATSRGGSVRLNGRAAHPGGVEFEVADEGGGLPGTVRSRLFQPCASTKPGGSGLGLALSHQLAQQAGGRLELVRSDARGTCFRLVLAGEA
jgi:signal transduction histidine kinase